jgi:hypothetical protein
MTRDERIAKIRRGGWIRYSRAEEITARLDHLLQLPTMHRMPNLLIIGETNNGKTALVNHFLAQHRAQLDGSGTPSCIPLVAVQAPPLPDERRFYQAILAQVFAPFRPRRRRGSAIRGRAAAVDGGRQDAHCRRDSARSGRADAQAAALSECHQVFGQ